MRACIASRPGTLPRHRMSRRLSTSPSRRLVLVQLRDIAAGRLRNPLDQCGQGVVSPSHFRQVIVPVVGTPHAGKGVSQATLTDVRIDARSAQQTPCGSAKIMQSVVRYAGRRVEGYLVAGKCRERLLALAENERAVASLAFNYGKRRQAERASQFKFCFVSAGRRNPITAVKLLPCHAGGLGTPCAGQQQKP